LGVIPIIKTDNVSWIVAQKIRHYSIQYVQNILWTNIGIINILWPNIGIKNNIIGYLGCVTYSSTNYATILETKLLGAGELGIIS
jgi:hypothetical protein